MRIGTPIVILVWNDGEYGLIDLAPAEATSAVLRATSSSANPDLVKRTPRASAPRGTASTSAERSRPDRWNSAIADETVVIIDCPVDYSENMKLTAEARQPRLSHLSASLAWSLDRMTAEHFPLMVPEARAASRSEVTTQLRRCRHRHGRPGRLQPARTGRSATAQSLFRDRDAWLPPYARVEILERAAAIMSGRDGKQLAVEAAREGGKPLVDSLVETDRAIDWRCKLLRRDDPANPGGAPRSRWV